MATPKIELVGLHLVQIYGSRRAMGGTVLQQYLCDVIRHFAAGADSCRVSSCPSGHRFRRLRPVVITKSLSWIIFIEVYVCVCFRNRKSKAVGKGQ